MKVVVTGGAGFIGSHLVHRLVSHGCEVHVIDNLSTGDAGRLHNEAILHICDICGDQAAACISLIKPDIIFHLAAQADVQRSIADPSHDAEVNIMGTLRLLEASRKAGVRKIIFASTSGVYGELNKDQILEDDPVSPISFYALSKLAGERYLHLYQQCFGLTYTILRYGNVYGPGQTPKGEGGVIAVFGDRLAQGLSLNVYGDGNQTRDFIYVQDVVSANLAAMYKGDGETIHVSTGQPTSINRLIQIVAEQLNQSIETHYKPAKTGDIVHSCLNSSKAKIALDWKPAYTIEQGLAETVKHWPI
ncbi:NAD-dependent epimerase/dehydratase family protein [Paenibacillus lemnae]|uniref:NAD-dependent epimerase/dehydratase family protein n=1 Tax=Paenibacillus lemnae TaxID=1330551 RepID=A0A848M6I8_PAELE|nr:NAD-dependent epimerase/dehydratase family protein [Paenibacillus lemnae]NMO95869.1 NAD-dependent epimerase/dehydratase family protein [Paenibacillus lemnae]